MGSRGSSQRLARAVVLACGGSALFLGGCGLVLDFDPEPAGTTIDASAPRIDASEGRDARPMDGGRADDGTGSDGDAPDRDAPEADAEVRDAGDGGADAEADAGPTFVCADPEGLGACSGETCDDFGCGPVTGDRCRGGVCVCGDGDAAPCRTDRHEVCGDGVGSRACTCEPDWADCVAAEPGCETNVMADADHCGGCGNACDGGEACVFGACRACGSDADCGDADGLACTTPRCDPTGECKEELAAGACVIDGACVGENAIDPDDACGVCDPGRETRDWSPAVGAPCDDGDACTINDACDASGSCSVSEPLECAPGDACHDVRCDPALGCTSELRSGFCFIGGSCVTRGTPLAGGFPCILCEPDVDPFAYTSLFGGEPCDDGVPCTESSCGAGSTCVVTRTTGCPFGGTCLAAGSTDPGNMCRTCSTTSGRLDWVRRPTGSSCEPMVDPTCLFGGFCTSSGDCVPVLCGPGAPPSLGLSCEGGDNCHCVVGRHDCDGRVDNGCECVGTACGSCVVMTG
ncbi:MAG: hypothetical protein IT379_34705 [Deltaproteobacteria bacterium]|nr:hypothetical protein [Deltaproteobacteria bacterium]